jgi:hypothetical protein
LPPRIHVPYDITMKSMGENCAAVHGDGDLRYSKGRATAPITTTRSSSRGKNRQPCVGRSSDFRVRRARPSRQPSCTEWLAMATRKGSSQHPVTAAGTVPELHRVPCTLALPHEETNHQRHIIVDSIAAGVIVKLRFFRCSVPGNNHSVPPTALAIQHQYYGSTIVDREEPAPTTPKSVRPTPNNSQMLGNS